VGTSAQGQIGRGTWETRQGVEFKPIPRLIEGVNRHLRGWKNYFDFGCPRQAFRAVNWYVRDRLTQHLRRRGQRPFRPPEGVSFYEQFQHFGLVDL